jgi:hypothetical protein
MAKKRPSKLRERLVGVLTKFRDQQDAANASSVLPEYMLEMLEVMENHEVFDVAYVMLEDAERDAQALRKLVEAIDPDVRFHLGLYFRLASGYPDHADNLEDLAKKLVAQYRDHPMRRLTPQLWFTCKSDFNGSENSVCIGWGRPGDEKRPIPLTLGELRCLNREIKKARAARDSGR